MIARYLPAKRLRHGSAGNIGDLVANVVLAKIVELSFVQAFAFQRDQANRQAGRVKLQYNRRQRSRRKAAKIGHREIRNGAEVGVGVRSWLKIDLDQAYAGKRARFDVVDAACQREQSFEWVGDVGFDLLRRHAGIKRGDDHDRNVDRRKQIHGHAHKRHGAHDGDAQTDHDNKEGILDGKAGHHFPPVVSPAGAAKSLGWIFWPLRNSLRLPMTTRS